MPAKIHTFSKQKYIEFLASQYAKEFGTPTPLLSDVAPKYLPFSSKETLNRAVSEGKIPFVAFRMSNQKSPYVVSVIDLAEFIFARSTSAKQEHITLHHYKMGA